MKTVLLTGGSGLLGRHIQDVLAEQGVSCVLLDRTHGYDITKPESYHQLLYTGVNHVTHVIHAAANTSFGLDKNKIFEVNCKGTTDFAEYCQAMLTGLQRFTYVSTTWADGLSPDGRHIVPYTFSKWVAEQALKETKLPLTIVRPSILVDEHSTSIIWIFLLAYALGKFSVNLEDAIDIVPARWAAEAIVALTLHEGPLSYQTYNISSNYTQQTYRRIFEQFDEFFGKQGIAQELDVFHQRYEKATYAELNSMIDSSDVNKKMKQVLKHAINTFGQIGAENRVFSNKPLIETKLIDRPPPLVNYVKDILTNASKFSMEEMVDFEMKD